MARRRSQPSTPQAREIAAGIAQGERRGYTQAQIAKAYGINERTVRKIKRGETPGTRIYARKVPKAKAGGTTPNIFRLDLELDDGMIRTVNLKAPNLRTTKGTRPPTPFDVFRMRGIQEAADAEAQRLLRQYGMTAALDDGVCHRYSCQHPAEDHDEPDEETGQQPCSRCDCPDYVGRPFHAVIAGLRHVEHRRAAIRVTIRGTVRA